jgi:hypothetical protein
MAVTPWASTYELALPGDINADLAVQSATDILYALSGQRFGGIREVTEDYATSCRRHWAPNPTTRYSTTALYMTGYGCRGQYPDACRSIRLRGGPVHSVTSISIIDPNDLSETTVDPTEYELVGPRSLIPLPGKGWPRNARVRVTYVYGEKPTAGARAACIELANQFLYAMNGDTENCRLPMRVTSVTRQGMSWTLLDPQEFMSDGRTGLYTIDLFLKTVNPSKALKRSRVFSPDVTDGRRIR